MSSVLDNTMEALKRAGQEGEVFLSLLPERARAEARQSDDRTEKLGPLDGATLSWKDMIAIEGVTARAGCAHWRPSAPATASYVGCNAGAAASHAGSRQLRRQRQRQRQQRRAPAPRSQRPGQCSEREP